MEGQVLPVDELQPGEAAGYVLHGDAGFQLAEASAEAVVQALTERKMGVGVGPERIEVVRIREDCGIPAGGG